jgi:two-component system response regulator DevR
MRILIADDNQLVRRGISGLLSNEKNWELCGEASNSAEIFQNVAKLRPDVVLLDVRMPGTSGLEVARLLRAESPEIKIIIMSQHDPNQLVPHAIQAGADACVDKARIGTDLVPTIKSIVRSFSPSNSVSFSAPNAANE